MSPSVTCNGFVAINIYINGLSVHFWTNVRQIVPLFAARFSGVFADVQAPGDEEWEKLRTCTERSVLDP